jgi:anti-sigma B factor antagonist
LRHDSTLWRFSVAHEVAGNLAIVTAAGRLNRAAADQLEAELNQVVTAPQVVLDLSGIDYASSAALAVLTRFLDRREREAESVVLCGAGEALGLTLDLAGVSSRLKVAATRAAATALLTGSAPPR